MNQPIILVGTSKKQSSELATTLEANGFQVLRYRSISDLEKLGQEKDRLVVILDLDKASVSNRVLRNLKRKRPALQIIGISSLPFHPELGEAISSYLFACISKPVDTEELMYLLKSIVRDLPPASNACRRCAETRFRRPIP
ncbi:MAG: response regulator [Desulfomonile tiedjei]|nr:response regulator [Desulfomonile tiedjei]